MVITVYLICSPNFLSRLSWLGIYLSIYIFLMFSWTRSWMSLLHLCAFFIIWDFISLILIGSLHLWLLFFDGVFGFIIGWISLILQPERIPWFLMSLALLFVWFFVWDTRDWPITLRIWSQMWGGYCSIFYLEHDLACFCVHSDTMVDQGWLAEDSFFSSTINHKEIQFHPRGNSLMLGIYCGWKSIEPDLFW